MLTDTIFESIGNTFREAVEQLNFTPLDQEWGERHGTWEWTAAHDAGGPEYYVLLTLTPLPTTTDHLVHTVLVTRAGIADQDARYHVENIADADYFFEDGAEELSPGEVVDRYPDIAIDTRALHLPTQDLHTWIRDNVNTTGHRARELDLDTQSTLRHTQT